MTQRAGLALGHPHLSQSLVSIQDLEADNNGSHDRERVVRAASGGTLSEDSHGEQEGAAGTFGGGGDRLPSSTQESTGRPPARDATPPFNLSSSDL